MPVIDQASVSSRFDSRSVRSWSGEAMRHFTSRLASQPGDAMRHGRLFDLALDSPSADLVHQTVFAAAH